MSLLKIAASTVAGAAALGVSYYIGYRNGEEDFRHSVVSNAFKESVKRYFGLREKLDAALEGLNKATKDKLKDEIETVEAAFEKYRQGVDYYNDTDKLFNAARSALGKFTTKIASL